MVTKSKLKMALAAEKGTDFKKLNLHKKEKLANKKKAAKGVVAGKKNDEEWEDVEEEREDVIEDGEDSGSDAEEAEGKEGLMKVYSFLSLVDFWLMVCADQLRRNRRKRQRFLSRRKRSGGF